VKRLARRPRPEPPARARSPLPFGVEQAVYRACAAQLVAAYGTQDAAWKLRQLIDGALDDETAAVIRGQLDVIACRVFRGRGSQWGVS